MSEYVKIAWRNLWRNKKRTIITASSVFFGVFFSIMMTSMQKGSFENMIENMAKFYSGYIQIQNIDFKHTPSVNNSFTPNDSLQKIINNISEITLSTKRVETMALASNSIKSYPSIIIGIEPTSENKKSNISRYVKSGSYLKSNSPDILVGKTLAENLNINVNDSLILIGQGYHGVSAIGIFKVSGLIDFPLPDLSKQIIYMDIATCQKFVSLNNMITSEVIMVESTASIPNIKSQLQKVSGKEIAIYSWEEMIPEILNLIEGKESSGAMVKSLLFLIIGFGVWSTIIMMMHERKRELAVMVAIGFRKSKLIILMLTESIFIGILGVISSIIVSYPIFWYLFKNPILVTGELAKTYESLGFEAKIAFDISPEIFYKPAITIFIIFSVISLYQIYYIAQLNIVKSLKS